ncbi:MAG: putative manganese transporter, partial [Thermodesulfobacteriota bacterium]|nr:putative manganese transporter [Thermodesulfobacteriota bacterium]
YSKSQKRLPQAFEVHLEDNCNCFPSKDILNQWKRCTPSRGVLATTLAIFLVFLVIGEVGPGEWGWIKITILSSTLMGLFIVCTVPDHFIEEHLWEHVVKKHAPRVFMWTFGALLIMSFITGNMHLEDLVHDNTWAVMLAAALVGIIPESGPHLIFLTMYAKALIPVSIFIVSSIVQDGHGMLPLLAYSRRDFLVVKLINIVVGLVVGIVLLCFGL